MRRLLYVGLMALALAAAIAVRVLYELKVGGLP